MTRDEKEQMFLSVLPLVRQLASIAARKYGSDRDELIQDCCAHVWVVLDKYDATRSKASTFVWKVVRNHLLTLWNVEIRSRPYRVQLKGDQTNVPEDRDEDLDLESGDSVARGMGIACGLSPSIDFEGLLKPCTSAERDVLAGVYRDGQSFTQLGKRRGVTPERISQIKRRGIERIRTFFEAKG